MIRFFVLTDANPEDPNSGSVEEILNLDHDITAMKVLDNYPEGTSVCKRNEAGRFTLVAHKKKAVRHAPAR